MSYGSLFKWCDRFVQRYNLGIYHAKCIKHSKPSCIARWPRDDGPLPGL